LQGIVWAWPSHFYSQLHDITRARNFQNTINVMLIMLDIWKQFVTHFFKPNTDAIMLIMLGIWKQFVTHFFKPNTDAIWRIQSCLAQVQHFGIM